MKIPRSGLIWFLIVGIPLLAISIVGLLSSIVGLESLDDACARWCEEIGGEKP